MLMPAGTKSLAIGKPFRVLLLVASPGLYTACPGWSATLEVLACATRAKCEMLGHARICTSFCCCCTHGRLQCAVVRPARPTRTPEPRIAFKLRRYGPRGPSPRHVVFLPFFSFPFLLPANQPFSLPRIGMGFWMAPRYSSSALSSTISNYLSIMGPRPTGLTFASC